MTRTITKETGFIDQVSGKMIYEVIHLSKSEKVSYELLERILEAIPK